MLQNPRLKGNYHAELLDDGIMVLISDKDQVLLSDKMQNLVLSEIQRNGVSIDELIENLAARASEFAVCHAVAILEKRGYICEASPETRQEERAFWNGMGMDVNALYEVLQSKTVELGAVGPLDLDTFAQAFRDMGIGTGENGVLKVIITDDYGRDQFRGINRQALATGNPWMLVKPTGVEIWIGPVFSPGDTGCWECLKQRLDINRPLNDFYRARTGADDDLRAPVAYLPLSLRIAADRTALEVVKWLYFEKNETLEGAITTFDMRSTRSRSHKLAIRPQCRACGAPERSMRSLPIVLGKKPSRCKTTMGGYREVPFEETLGKYVHHVSPITGIMPILEPYHPVEGAPIYNYTSGRNMAMRSRTLFWLNKHVRSGNGGKGRSRIQAKAGALCEAIERYGLTYHNEEPHIVSSLRELGDDGINPNACMLYSEKQYRNRESINQTYTKFYNLVPVPFDESLSMHWTPVYSLTEKKFRHLPSCFCYAQYPAEDDFHLFSYPDSNGAAAGNSPEEAILQGFLELVERDSVALWWHNMLGRPAVDLRSFDDPYFVQLIEYYRSLHRSLSVLDMTADLQIPAFGAVSHRTDGGPQDIVFGFGAHLDARIGVERALIELNQMLPIANVTEEERSRGKYRTPDQDFLDWLSTATTENRPYVAPLKDQLKTASDFPRLCEPNIFDSVMYCIDSARRRDIDVLALDMTRPDIGLPVYRVFAPGLRHFWKRLGPGRLYEVPVRMGWLKEPLEEEEMNPAPLFI
jgi:bacteriocin biosynthesis cyclodehydratase domain-containing protein